MSCQPCFVRGDFCIALNLVPHSGLIFLRRPYQGQTAPDIMVPGIIRAGTRMILPLHFQLLLTSWKGLKWERTGALPAVIWAVYQLIVVKANLLICQSKYTPALTCGHQLWVETEWGGGAELPEMGWARHRVELILLWLTEAMFLSSAYCIWVIPVPKYPNVSSTEDRPKCPRFQGLKLLMKIATSTHRYSVR